MGAVNTSIFYSGENYFGNVLLNPSTLAKLSTSYKSWKAILDFHHELATDKYTQYTDDFYRACLDLYSSLWVYFDIVNVLYGASSVLSPLKYLEIGVRRGRSACTVVRGCPTVDIYGSDV